VGKGSTEERGAGNQHSRRRDRPCRLVGHPFFVAVHLECLSQWRVYSIADPLQDGCARASIDRCRLRRGVLVMNLAKINTVTLLS
jgi:hypothetical protein